MLGTSALVLSGLATALLCVAVTPAAATPGERTLAITHGAEGTTLALEGRAPFHATGNNLVNPYTLAIPGTNGVAIVWEEVSADGLASHYYAVSRDGRATPRVIRTSYRLKLRYAEFDPALDAPFVPALLRADAASALHIVQFVTQPLPEFQAYLLRQSSPLQKFGTVCRLLNMESS